MVLNAHSRDRCYNGWFTSNRGYMEMSGPDTHAFYTLLIDHYYYYYHHLCNNSIEYIIILSPFPSPCPCGLAIEIFFWDSNSGESLFLYSTWHVACKMTSFYHFFWSIHQFPKKIPKKKNN
jgi:hypothetical protein